VGAAASQTAGCVVCCVSVPLAISISLTVIAISWVVARPTVALGIWLPVVLLTQAAAAYFYWLHRVKSGSAGPKKTDAPTETAEKQPEEAPSAVGSMNWDV
jgi:hypothetical protein